MLRWFDHMKLRTKFLVPIALMLLVGLAALGSVLMRVQAVNEAVKEVDREQEKLTNLQQSLILLQQQQLIEKNYLLTGDWSYTETHTELNDEVDVYLQSAKDNSYDGDDLTAIEAIEEEMDNYHEAYLEMIEFKRNEDHETALQMTLEKSDLSVSRMNDAVVDIMTDGKERVAQKTAEAEQERQEALILSIVSLVIFALVAIGAALLSRRTATPVLALTTAAAAVESENYEDMSLDPLTERHDELGQLARVFRKMAAEVYRREKALKEQVQTLKIEIDNAMRQKEVAEITSSDYFQQLQEQAKKIRESKNK